MEFVNLSNVCDVYSGYAFKNFNENKEGMPVIKIGNIKTDGSINKMSCSYTDETPLEKFFSQKDDLYIALSGATTGKVGIMDESGYLINQRVGVIRRKDMNIPINYIKFFLDSITEKILKDAVGAAQPNISPRDILNYKFPLKTYNEMSIISNVLTKINGDIKKCKNYIANLDNIVKSQFIEMFGDVFYNDNGYKLVKIGDVVKYEQPTKYIVSSEDYNESFKIPVLTAGKSFILGYTDENDGIFYGSKEKVVIFDDFTCDSKIVDFDFKVKSSAMKLLHMTKDINVDFFYHALKQNHYNVANHKRHWISVFEIMEMGLPSIEEQNEFSKFVQQIDKSKFIVQKQIKLLEELLEKKMNEYFGQ